MNCEHCDAVFKSKTALNNHKKTAKYCLLIQGKIEPEPEPEKEILKCSKCKKTLSSKQYLDIHSRKCRAVVEKQEEVYKCSHCSKILSTKQNLSQHLTICLEKKRRRT